MAPIKPKGALQSLDAVTAKCSWNRELIESGLIQRRHAVDCGGGDWFLIGDDAPSAICGNHKALLETHCAAVVVAYGMTFKAV